MTDTVIHVGDIGTIFRVTIVENDGVTPVNVSSATVKKILFQKGDGARVEKTAVFLTDGTDGIIQYVGIAADVSVAGNWQMQGYVEMPSGKFYSEKVGFKVMENLSQLAIKPIRNDRVLNALAGDDYYLADGRAMQWVSTSWPDLTGATVKFISGSTEITMTVVTAGVGEQTVSMDVPAATSTAMKGEFKFILQATLASTHVVTLLEGEGRFK